MHEVLVNRSGGLSMPRKSVVRLTDRPDVTLDVYRGRKTSMQQQQPFLSLPSCSSWKKNFCNMFFLCPATKNGGVLCYTLRTFECLSVRLSVRPSVRLSVRPSVRQWLNIRVRSITLIPFEIISRNLVQI